MNIQMLRRVVNYSLLFTVLFFIACEKQSSTSTNERPLMILVGSDVTTFDPQIPFELDTGYVTANIFESLVEFDSSFQLSPGLARRWTNPDDRTWRFYLNPDARFSDGTPLEASDVKFSIERLQTLTDSDLIGFVEHIAQVKAVDSQTVDIQTDIPISILNNLVFVPIVSEEHVKRVGARISEMPMGTGPYKLVRWQKKQRIMLTANEYYQPKLPIRDVEFIINEDPDAVLNDVVTLKPDLTLSLPFRKIEELEKQKIPELRVVSTNGITVEYLIFNLRPTLWNSNSPNPLADIRSRRAFACATDQQELIGFILKGFGRPATQLIAPEIFGFDPSIRELQCDPDKDLKPFRESRAATMEIPLHTLEGGTYRLEKMLMQQWGKHGIKTKLQIWKTVDEMNRALIDGEFALALGAYVCTSGDASELLTYGLHTRTDESSYGKGNYASYSNAEVDEICENNLRILNPRERLNMLQKAMRIVAQDIPYFPLLIFNDVYVVSHRVKWVPPVNGEIKIKNISFNGRKM